MDQKAKAVLVKLDGDALEVNHQMTDNRVSINLVQTTKVKAGQLIKIEIST